MSLRTPWLALAALPIIVSSVCAQNKDAIELLPAQSPACLELRHPPRLAREIAALVKGSILDDLPRRLAKRREQGQLPYWALEQLSMLSVFLCPEAMDEAGRIRGGFVALTGFDKDNMPSVVGVLQSGSSNFPGMVFRGFTTSTMVHTVGEVEGVTLYREKLYRNTAMLGGYGGGNAPQPQERESGPIVGRLPGAILFGSSVDGCKDVIRRAKRKSAEASLATLRAFKDAAALREKPGLFAYVDVTALQAKLEEILPKGNNAGSPMERTLLALVGKDGVRDLMLSLTLQSGELEGRMRCGINPKSENLLMGLTPDRTAPRNLLHFAPANALLALACGFDDNDKRWQALLKHLDALYEQEGRPGDNRPSRAVVEVEKKLNFRIDKDVLAHLTGAGFAVAKREPQKPPQVLLLLQARDAEAAAQLEKEGLPKLFSLSKDEVFPIVEEEVRGRRISTMKRWLGPNLFLPPALHFGRQGTVLVVGFDPDSVAAALVAGSKKEGLLGEAKVTEAVKNLDEKAVAIAVVSSQAALNLLAALNRPRVVMAPPAAPGLPPQPAVVEQPRDGLPEDSKAVHALRKESEPLVFALHRQPESLLCEMRPLPLRRMTPQLLDAWVETLLKATNPESPLPRGERIKR